ncbi:MAG: hypothetical protein Q7U04_01760 [Bacteriovorax sp.]|nr:hypothetical protein [Bacteriovorax sp.]
MDSSSILTESGRNKSMQEDKMTTAVEKQTSKMPTSFFLILSGVAVALSLGLAISKKEKRWANYVGQWVPTILLLVIYDKIAKNHSADKKEKEHFLH